MEALELGAALGAQPVALLGGLDAFGRDLHAEQPAEAHDPLDDAEGVLLAAERAGERARDLDLVELLQVAQAGIAGAEVVDRDPDAQSLELVEDRAGDLGVAQQRALGDLELEAFGLEAGLGERLADLVDQLAMEELRGRQVDRHADPGPGGCARAGLVQHPGAERHDQAGLLGDRQELAGQDQALLRVAPAQQGLEADHRLGGRPDLRLVVELELALGEAAPEVGLERLALPQLGVHLRLEEADAAQAQALGAAQREVGVLEEVVRVPAVGRDQHDADARAQDQGLLVDLEGLGQGVHEPPAERVGGTRLIRLLLHDRELVAADAGDRVAVLSAGHQALRAGLDHPVAGAVAKRVVELAEPVQVEGQERRPLAALARARQGVLDPLEQAGAVGKVGQRVVHGQMPGLRLGDRRLGDVGAGAAEAAQSPGGVVQRAAMELQVALAAVRQGDAEAEIAERTAADQIGAVAHPGLVVHQNAAGLPGCPGPRELDQGRRRMVRDHHQALLGVDLPQPFGRGGGELGEAPFRVAAPRHLGADLAPAPGRDDPEGDREDHQQRQELVEQPAPLAGRPGGEQPGDVDQRPRAPRSRPRASAG